MSDHIPDTSKMMWISVSDRFPDKFTSVLVSHYCRWEGDTVVTMASFYDGEWYDEASEPNGIRIYPTHWMPLPDPPL